MENGVEEQRDSVFTTTQFKVTQKYNAFLDRVTPYTKTRWGIFVVTLLLFIYRMVHFHKYYIYAYTSGIYILFQFVAFLTPISIDDTGDPLLPDATGAEYRPFMRRLSEKKFWVRSYSVVLLSFVMSFTFIDLPVFWPILLLYFIVLFIVTMQTQIKHMIQHKYVPFDFGKKTYDK
ncbi:protein RER1, putative [Entamoeba invadens IP1]|uniref:protein RER1, putative n=1 Tax=Entamoeba invadens IP1 TaxID=370355 RepID=UPI0002C3E634|nr:protein RER1, putative [Entamoeba invadens IP1]ELP93159.1 protein RER1, putative [Entamoeba invadens IP1]|eukprot:XP_004259930.1 protein RER1, putative [Entamoeba invadens IP1]